MWSKTLLNMFFKPYSYDWHFQLRIWKIHIYSLYLSECYSIILEKFICNINSYKTFIHISSASILFPILFKYIGKIHIHTITSHKKCSNSNMYVLFTFHCSSPHTFQTQLQQLFDIYSDIVHSHVPNLLDVSGVSIVNTRALSDDSVIMWWQPRRALPRVLLREM